jgi:HK97 family phage prohead protease
MTLEGPDTGRDGRAASGSTSLPLGARDEAWDAGAAEKLMDTAADLARFHFWKDPDGDPAVKASYKLPFGTPADGGHAVWRGVTAAAQRLGSADIPDADVAGVRAKIAAYYSKARAKYEDDSIQVPWQTEKTAEDDDIRFCVTTIEGIEVRDPTANPDDTWTMSGQAAVFNQTTTLYDGKMLKVTESIDPGFFDECLRTQGLQTAAGVVHYNLGHDMNRAVAATNVPAGQPGWLDLNPSPTGLDYLAKVARDDPDGVAMASKMRTGVLRQASFAFTVAEARWETIEAEDGPDTDHRVLVRAKHLYDVCACPQGAYPQTTSDLRGAGSQRDYLPYGLLHYAAQIGYPVDLVERAAALAHQPESELRGVSTINAPAAGGRGDELAKARLRAQSSVLAARHRHPGR